MGRKEFLKELQEERATYKGMIDFCCDNLILNNCIIEELTKQNFYFNIYCGDDTEYQNADGEYITQEEYFKLEEEGEQIYSNYVEIYQYYIISEYDAERLAKYTNELVYYNEDLDLYLLGVCHYGTSWDYVPSNWKELHQIED